MSISPESVNSVIYALKERVFDFHKNPLSYRRGFDPELAKNHHAPLARLYSLYDVSGDRLDIPTKWDLACTENSTDTIILNGHRLNLWEVMGISYLVETRTNAITSELLDLAILSPSDMPYAGSSLDFKQYIPTAQSVAVHGVMGVHSAYNTLAKLHDHGYRGVVTFMDISPVPLQLIEEFMNLMHWQEIFGIKVELLQTSTVDMHHTLRRKYDITMIDILGHYLSDDDLSMYGAANSVAPGGWLLVRDMAELQPVPPRSREVAGNLLAQDENFKAWVLSMFGYTISMEEIADMKNSFYPDPLRKPRGMELPTMWLQALGNADMQLRKTLATYPQGADPAQRIFIFQAWKRN